MHILFVASWWPSIESPLNGIFIQEHALAISKYAKVTVLYLNSIEKSLSWTNFPSGINKSVKTVNSNLDVITIDVKLRIRRFGILKWQVIRLIKDLLTDYSKDCPVDIIHTNVLPFILPDLIIENSSVLNKPIVHTEHSSFYHTEIYDLSKKEIEIKKKRFKKLFNKPHLKFVLPVSNQLGEILVNDYGLSAHKIIKVPNVANDCFVKSNIKHLNLDEGIVISLAATWQSPKNPLLFLDVLKLIKKRNEILYKKIKINWIGEGPQIEGIKQFVIDHLTDLKIVFSGRLTKNEIVTYLENSHFLVHPTDAENLPCIIIESLCVGLPVFTAKVNGCVELINLSNGTFYEPKDFDNFYLKFNEMIENIKYFKKEKIADSARKMYSSDAIGKSIFEIYKLILEKDKQLQL